MCPCRHAIVTGTQLACPLLLTLFAFPTRGPYIALSKQHTLWALQQLRSQYEAAERALPKCMVTVKASILRHSTPIDVRQAVSGGEQNRESTVVYARISRVVELLLQVHGNKGDATLMEDMKKAIQLSGIKRPQTSRQLTDDWGGIAKFAVAARDVAVNALEEMEKRGLAQSPGSLRKLQSLILPEFKRHLAQHMLADIRTQQQLEQCIQRLKHEMLVSMHWREGNPLLTPEKGIIRESLLSVGRTVTDGDGRRRKWIFGKFGWGDQSGSVF